jgi:LuxR family transcriptional regulator, maltose regulon positive regulatory protein
MIVGASVTFMGIASGDGVRTPVLTPKLHVPLLPKSAVQRSRLLATLAAGEASGVRVTIVSAPAGSGKTLLLAEWSAQLQSDSKPVAWVSLAEEDNDIYVLWSSILTALARAVIAADPRTGSALGALGPPARRMETGFLKAFLEIMNSCRVPVWLVLDDAHEIVDRQSLHSLRTVLRNLPADLRLMLGCRHDMALPLGRLAVAGHVREIRFDEMAFDRAEVDRLLVNHGIHLADDDIEVLRSRTEGWAAGLRLATLSIVRHADAAKFLAGFAGDSRPVADYLVSEILSHQPADVLEFLLATAGPERLSVDLASRLSGRDDAGILLDQLEHANALVTRLGEGSTWYRYHVLLRSYLHAELNRRDVAAQRRLHVVAADWFVEHDLPRSGLEHAAAAKDWERVAQIIDDCGVRLLLSGETGALERALASLPVDFAARPVVALTAALTALEVGDLAAATRQLDQLGRESTRYRDPRLQVLNATALLYEARLRGDRAAGFAELIESASTTGVQDQDLVLLSLANRGTARLWMGAYADAEADLVAALRLARRDSRDFFALDCLSHLCATAAGQNDYVAMADRAQDAIAFARERGWASSARMASAYLVAAWAAWQMLDRAGAARYATLAEAVIEADVEPDVDAAARCLGAFVDFERGADRRGALQRLRRHWLRLDGKRLAPALVATTCGTEQHLALAIGETGWAADVVARAERYLGEAGDTQVLRAIMSAHHGRNSAARKALAPVLAGDNPCYVVTSEIAAWLMASYYAEHAGERSNAHDALVAALDLAAPRRAMRQLVNAPVPVRDVLIRNVGRYGPHEQFVADVLSAAAAPRWPESLPELTEPLTSRELTVLRDLPSLLSVEDVAEAHVVSVNTIKTHLKAIYRKLGVNSRREAVDRARELGLL